MVVPFAPGGGTDAIARAIGVGMAQALGQPVIVDNKPGAGTIIGTDLVAKSPADGYTVVVASFAHAVNPSLMAKLPFDTDKAFSPVILLARGPNVLVVRTESPFKSVADVVAAARSQPGKVTYASSGNGASSHLAGVMFNKMAGTDFVHVPYKGTGPALNDLLGGQVAMTFTDVLTALPHIKAGKLRALGVTTKARSQVLPDVPTIAEQGIEGFDVSVFFGLVVPAGTPKAAIDTLNQAFAAALKDPQTHKTLANQGLEFAPSTTPDQLGGFIASEVVKWRDVVKASGATIN